MFMKRPGHRIFDYTPRFYNPETDKKERRKRRLGFTRQRKFGIKKKRSPIVWLVLIIVIIYIIIKLGGVT
jgi:hypothetical protein